MKFRLACIGIVAAVCLGSLSCVTHVYHPAGEAPAPVAPPPPAVEPAAFESQPFYDDLAPHGRWVYASGPGWVWSPYGVAAGWRPYQLGRWVFTDHGWTWASDEDWGWVVYHYGRWHRDPGHGWVWVPGTEWGPAWVAWHEGGGWVGWSPLPWQVRWRAGVGLDWGGVRVTVDGAWWSFVETRHLADTGLHRYIAPVTRNVSLIRITKNVTHYTVIQNRVVNQGVRSETVSKAAGRLIPRYRVQTADAPETARGGRVSGRDFVVYRPDPARGREPQRRAVPPGHDAARQRGGGRPGSATVPAEDDEFEGMDAPVSPETAADGTAEEPPAEARSKQRPEPPARGVATGRSPGRILPGSRSRAPGRPAPPAEAPAPSDEETAPETGTPEPEKTHGRPADTPASHRPATPSRVNRPAAEAPRPEAEASRPAADRPAAAAPEPAEPRATTPRGAGAAKGQPARTSGRDAKKDPRPKQGKPAKDDPAPEKQENEETPEATEDSSGG